MFPKLFTIGVCTYSEGATDSHGNPTKGWSDPVDTPVYGWGPPQSDEPKLAGHDRVTVDVEVLVPDGFTCGPHDRVVLDGETFNVAGRVEAYSHNPFGWSPGGVLNLHKAEG